MSSALGLCVVCVEQAQDRYRTGQDRAHWLNSQRRWAEGSEEIPLTYKYV